ncbi:MAG TPA: S8 family serine peptidase [Pyrinomonadaceae bacterium]
MPKSIYRISTARQPRFPRQFSRVLFGLATALILVVFIAGALNLRSSAQGNDTHGPSAREAAFNRKTDRLLRSVRRAVDEDRAAAAKGQLRSESSAVNRLSRIARIKRQPNGDVRLNVAITLAGDSERELEAAGFRLQSRVGDVATLDVSVDQLPELAALNSVQKIFASVVRRPLNDRARQSAGVDNSSGQRVVTQTGRGVVVGIIDTGIDFRHLDFTVPGSGGHQTRIKAMLDMTEYGTQSPDPNWNYSLPGQAGVIGHLYTEADINSALQIPKPAQSFDIVKQRDKAGHGTHVAGTAAGNGLASPTAGTYAGMAPEADLVIVKASRQNDGGDDFDTTDLINAMEFVRQKAAELGEPFVINLSIGGQIGPHDGTTPDERAIDNLVNGGAGRVVCVAAGNEGGGSIHARGTISAGGSQTLDFNVNGDAYIVDLYQNKADRFSVTVTSPDGVSLGPIAYDPNGFALPAGQGSNQYLEVFNANDDKGDGDAANDQPNIVLLFKPAAPDGMWKITLQDADSNPNQSYDAWATGDGVYFSNFLDNESHLVASPGTARGAITVGAFVTRSATQTIGTAASFTSPGPTADGRQKPDISAPGYYLYSSRSTDISDSNFGVVGSGGDASVDNTHYAGLAGTSMATPVTTGSVALLIQSSPTLSATEVKSLLTTYAALDIWTGSAGWGPRFGFGKLNIANAINRSGGGFKRFSINGRLADPGGTPVVGLQVFLSGSSSAMAITDANGNFSFPNLSAGGNYFVKPSFQPSMTFSPESFTFNNLGADQTANFTRTTTATYRVGGRITDAAGNGVAGISVEVPGSFTVEGHFPILPATSDVNGYYQFDLPKGQDYHLTPTSDLYTFTPTVITFTNLSSGQTANFSAVRVPAVLTGQVIQGTSGLAGVSVNILLNGTSQSTTVLTDANGFYSLAVTRGQYYTITPAKTGYNFEPANQTLYFNSGIQPRLFIGSDNPIDGYRFFVAQHYRDFLGREADDAGLGYWANEMAMCDSSLPCIDAKRVNTSAAFFLSIEFQETGYLVERIYRSAYGEADALSALNTYPSTHPIKAPIVKFAEFLPDQQQIAKDVMVGIGNWQAQLESNKVAFTQDFVTRPRFVAAFPTNMTPAAFVDQLFANAGVTPTPNERGAIIDEFGGAGTSGDVGSRARALRRVAENAVLTKAETNKAFVLMQYFGYLRRDPNSGPDTDHTGYDFWLGKLNEHNGNFVDAEMVKAFIVSIEYRKRFH